MEEEKLLDEIRSWCDGWCFDNKTALEMLRGYAESYHAKRCADAWTDISIGTLVDGEYIVKVKNDRGQIFVTTSFCEDGQFDDVLATHEILAYQELPLA